ncbi:bacterial transcriptional regulator family protein 23 [Achromobacter xylosoxidans A8]|uniref:Bacterial transcriptional regulator family protein 23 n=2 Tax=Alcaligenaceae TaxID=506 RepID=E3HXB0_ACHXA|nr:bacterial transcriptional regulator family protein 23 [Achromobacter xylosoxidans A8]
MVKQVKQAEMSSKTAKTKEKDKAARPEPAASQTLLRGLDIIESVAAGVSDLGDIAQHTGMTYSTVHRMVLALARRNYLKRDPQRGYMLGRKLLELGFHAYSEVELTQIARPILQGLADQTSDTVHLATMDHGLVIYLDKIASRRAIEISSRIGGSKPLISTGVGKALLLDAGEQEWEAIYENQRHLLRLPVSKAAWLKLMRNYAQAGYAYDTGEDEPSIRCVAAPIRDGRRKTVAAVSVSSTLEYMDEKRMAALVPVVCEAARRISAELGSSQG